jgi:hypothetical protein
MKGADNHRDRGVHRSHEQAIAGRVRKLVEVKIGSPAPRGFTGWSVLPRSFSPAPSFGPYAPEPVATHAIQDMLANLLAVLGFTTVTAVGAKGSPSDICSPSGSPRGLRARQPRKRLPRARSSRGIRAPRGRARIGMVAFTTHRGRHLPGRGRPRDSHR